MMAHRTPRPNIPARTGETAPRRVRDGLVAQRVMAPRSSTSQIAAQSRRIASPHSTQPCREAARSTVSHRVHPVHALKSHVVTTEMVRREHSRMSKTHPCHSHAAHRQTRRGRIADGRDLCLPPPSPRARILRSLRPARRPLSLSIRARSCRGTRGVRSRSSRARSPMSRCRWRSVYESALSWDRRARKPSPAGSAFSTGRR
mmetsp:Transcript_69587/g.185607  ORF Transcript_69587/g.185607 Transcript_69587/m.185607 type:complete len:202 (-) Transcript_69587:846-1451(-)